MMLPVQIIPFLSFLFESFNTGFSSLPLGKMGKYFYMLAEFWNEEVLLIL